MTTTNTGPLVPHEGAAPVYQHDDDAGADLCATDTVRLPSGGVALVPTGTRLAIPDGHVGLVCPRSGLALTHAVTVLNAPGIIDAGYRGDVGVILINHGRRPHLVHAGDRIAQLVILPFARARFTPSELVATTRGAGGFGSTGAS